MKNILYIVALLFFLSCQGSSDKTNIQRTTQQGTAKFVFQEEMHNFGSLQAGEIVAYTFQFSNEGTGILVIEKAEADCGCVTVNIPEMQIQSGQTGTVEVIFDSAGEVGNVLKEVAITSNAEKKVTTLSIAANVKNELINIYTQN